MGLGLGLSITNSGYVSFLPTDISNLALWFQNGVGITSDGGTPDKVSQWNDSSGNGNNATQGTSGNQADLVGGGLDFTAGESDHYDLASTVTIAQNQGFCVAIVMDTDTSSNNFIFSKDANDHIQIGDGQTFIVKTNDPGVINTQIVCPAGTFGNQKQLILVNRSDGASNTFSVFKNGSEVTIDSSASSNEATGENPNGFDINVLGSQAGTGNFFDGTMFEVLFFDKGLSSTEISDLNTYLTSKHGL